MTQSVATTGAGAVQSRAVSPVEPMLSPALDWRVDRAMRGLDLMRETLKPGERDEALQAAEGYALLLGPAGHSRIEQWMDKVALAATVDVPSERASIAFRALVIETSGDLPLGCWTRETRAAFARHRGERARYWPSDGEIDAFLRPIAARMRKAACALAEMGKSLPPPPPQPSEPTDEEKAQVAAMVDEFVAGMESSRMWAVIDDAAQKLPGRSVTLKGRELWDRRNLTRAASGLPELPEPASFDGYGTLPPDEGRAT